MWVSSYGRIDLWLREDVKVFVIEAKPNPNISFGEDLPNPPAASASTSFCNQALIQPKFWRITKYRDLRTLSKALLSATPDTSAKTVQNSSLRICQAIQVSTMRVQFL